MTRRLIISGACLATLFAVAPRGHAQDPVLRPDTIEGVADTIPREAPLPRGAFIRAMLVPGWGHLYIGSLRRGAVYFAIQSSSWYMLVKTLRKLDAARDVTSDLEQFKRDSLNLEAEQDTVLAKQFEDNPDLLEQLIDQDTAVVRRRGLVRAREAQREDWIVYLLFFTFASAVDAYVTAHLADFPGEITTSRSSDGGISVGLRLNVGSRRQRNVGSRRQRNVGRRRP